MRLIVKDGAEMAAKVILASLLAMLCADSLRADTAATALNCLNCHGTDTDIPMISGRPEQALIDALLGFRHGDKPSTVMSRIVGAYSDDELLALARYFSKR